MALRNGERLGPYEVLGPLGAGGMGEVYAARDVRLGRDVALKVLPSDTVHDAERLARFRREARTVAALNHPNVVTLHDVEEWEGRPVLVMERVGGRTLSRLLESEGGRLPLERLVEIAEPVAAALAAAHERGIVHRDLKPANVMVSDDGRVKVLDFGLAQVRPAPTAAEASEAATETRVPDDRVAGTVPYMAPEQLQGRAVDGRADVFSLGVMLYEMAAGSRPFRGDSVAEVMAGILREAPPDLAAVSPTLPPRLVRLIGRCLEKDPRRRVQSAGDLRHELEDIADEQRAARLPAREGAAGSVARARPFPRPWIAASLIVAVVVVASWLAWRGGASRAGRSPIHSIAVLPFANLGHDASQDYVVDGLHDALITELAKLGSLHVTSRNSVMRYKGRAAAAKDVARELGVDALVEGSVLRSGNRINAQLVRGATDEHVWAESYDREIRDVLGLLSDLSNAIAREVQAKAGGSRPTAPPPVRPEAYEEYLRARQIVNEFSFRTLPEASAHARRAVQLDPGLAAAWATLAQLASIEAFFRTSGVGERVDEARLAARQALAIDPREGAAHGALGFVALYFDWDFETARREIEEALTLSPHDSTSRHAYADYLMACGHLDESLEQVRIGREDDPTSPLMQVVVLFHTVAARHPDDIVREARTTLARYPRYASGANLALADLWWREAKYPAALAAYREALGAEDFAAFEEAYRKGGARAAKLARAQLLERRADLGEAPDYLAIAGSYAEAGDADHAFATLDRAYAVRYPQLLHVIASPELDSLRRDPRYHALLGRIGVPLRQPAEGPAR
jgi:TolB-like protein/tetratricopeptide (TPR) repeat protein